MEQQTNFTKSHILDLSVHEHSPGGNFSSSSRYDQRVFKNKPNTMRIMSEEELKIRGELESEIEGNLEEEIKDGIYHLALRLHRLYQHQKERNAKHVIGSDDHKKNKTFSEVNINIKMEDGTKIEIKEMKKEAPDKSRPRTSRSENMQPLLVSNNRKFDWAKSLRSGKGPTPIHNINKSNRSSNQAKIISNKYQGFSSNSNLDKNTRRNLISSHGQRKGTSSVGVDNKVLELEWKC